MPVLVGHAAAVVDGPENAARHSRGVTSDSTLLQLLDLASRSPSSHNTQPWILVRTDERRLVLRSEPSRWLRKVDPTNRELLLSFGAFIETIRQAAPTVGYRIDLEVLADRGDASDIAQMDLDASPPVSSTAPALIRSRASTRTPFLPVELPSNEVDQILDLDRPALLFASRQSSQGRWLADATLQAFVQQVWDDGKQAELAQWLRFSRREVRSRGDGLTPDALGLSPPARAVWYAAFTRKQALRPSFRRSSIKLARRQLEDCAGFLLVTGADRSVRGLIEAGELYQRALLRATDLGMAHHTMSYALEEDPWRQEIDSALQSRRPIQFIVRVGRARQLARPSVRRPPVNLLVNRMA
jgi:hypothetical protein